MVVVAAVVAVAAVAAVVVVVPLAVALKIPWGSRREGSPKEVHRGFARILFGIL